MYNLKAQKRTGTINASKTKDKEELIKPNGDVKEDKRNGEMCMLKNVHDNLPTPLQQSTDTLPTPY